MAAFVLPVLLAACSQTIDDISDRANQPLSPQLIALMHAKGTNKYAPVLLRAFKKESIIQVWKMKADGHYTLLKSYPICRWSGQLGPKKRDGDRQVPEGFYTITSWQLNPNSHYYLSFNIGYPNAYDRAHGYTGDNIMVHGVCSSRGCFSMTDKEIAEIYAIMREAFAGGQKAVQMQSYPFYMTPKNFAEYRRDPNITFWKELRVGNDNFEVTKKDVAVGVCDRHYVFNAEPADGRAFDPTGPCPPLKRNEKVALAVAAKEKADDAKVAQLIARGVEPIRTVYADGSQNPVFAKRRIPDVSRPYALAEGAVNISLDKGKHYRAQSHARLEAAAARAKAAAIAAEKKAAAAHAYAYVDPSEAAQTRAAAVKAKLPAEPAALAPRAAGPQATPAQTAQTPAAAPQTARPQTATSHAFSFHVPGLSHLFGAAPAASAAPPVPNSLAAPRPADVPLPPLREQALAAAPRTNSKHGLGQHKTLRPKMTKTKAASTGRTKSALPAPTFGTIPLRPTDFSAAPGTQHF